MIIELIFIVCLLYLYFLIYISNKVNVNNEIFEFTNEQTRKCINSEINLKLPFYFNIEHLFKSPCNLNSLELIKKTNNYNLYQNVNVKYKLFEPYIKHVYENNIIKIKTYSNLHLNKNNTTFYFFHDENTILHLIHPSYKHHFIYEKEIKQDKKTIKYIKNNNNFIHFKPHKNDIVYVPNYWYVLIENTFENNKQRYGYVEKLTYKTLIDDLISLKEKYLIKK
jgi:hypothetical protein